MAQFSGELQYERLTKRWVWVKEDLDFYFTLSEVFAGSPPYLRDMLSKTGLKSDQIIHACAPRGFVTDLASVPFPISKAFPPDGPWARAAVIHDIAYQVLKENMPTPKQEGRPIDKLNFYYTRFMADRLFLLGMRALGINYVVRTAFYNAVRAGGKSSYGGTAMKEDYGVIRTQPLHPVDPYRVFRTDKTIGVPDSLSHMVSNKADYHSIKYTNLKRSFIFPVTFPENVSDNKPEIVFA